MQERATSDATVAATGREETRFDEDLPAMAAQAYALADRYCVHCRNFHALWPYRRLARMCAAAEAGAPVIERVMRSLLPRRGARILIAAAADTGLLATVARASAGLDPRIRVVDRCETPLQLCRQYAARWSLPLQTATAELTNLEGSDFDIVYANSVLQYLPPERRVDALARLRDALRPGGHLIIVFNAGAPVAGAIVPEYHENYANWMAAELDRQDVRLPDARETFLQRINQIAHERKAREGAFNDPGNVEAMLKQVGFAIKDRTQLAMPLSEPYQSFVAKLGKRRFLAVAQSPRP